MADTLPRDAAGEGGDLPLPEIEYAFVAYWGSEMSEQFDTRDQAREWIAGKREVSGNQEMHSLIDQIEV